MADKPNVSGRFLTITLFDDKEYQVARLPIAQQLKLGSVQKQVAQIQKQIDEVNKSAFKIDADGNVLGPNKDYDEEAANVKIEDLTKQQLMTLASLGINGLKVKHPDLTMDQLVEIADLDVLTEMISWMFGGRPGLNSFRKGLDQSA